MGFNEFAFSTQIRDTLDRMIKTSIDKFRPPYRYGTVSSVDYTTMKCGVILNGDTAPVLVNITTYTPIVTGQVVRVEGNGTDRYVAGVVGTQPRLTNDRLPALESIPPAVNLNTYRTPGVYVQGTAANATTALNYPVDNLPGTLEVGMSPSGTQVFHRFTSRVNTPPTKLFIRFDAGSGFQPWQEILSKDDTGWVTMTWTGITTPAGLQYRRINDMMMWRGEIYNLPAAGSVLYTIPTAFRPTLRNAWILGRVATSPTDLTASLTIQPTGEVYCQQISGTALTASPGFSIAPVMYPLG